MPAPPAERIFQRSDKEFCDSRSTDKVCFAKNPWINPGKICTKRDVTALAYFEVHQGEEGTQSSSITINLLFSVSSGGILPLAACSVRDGFPIPPASPGSHRGKMGRIIGGIIHLPQPLPSPIFWSAALWEQSVSGAEGTGRQRRISGEEIRAGFFPGWKTVCPRIYPKCKLNIPLSSTKLWWMGGCAASWQAGKWWTRCLSLFLLSLSRQELLCLLESFSASIWDTLIANLDFTLRKERGDRPDSEPHVYILKNHAS